MTDSVIVDSKGKPFKAKSLTQEVATPSITGVRQAWMSDSVAGRLTPFVLANLLQSANEGNDYDYLTLAEEMEEREWHYSSVLGTRKRSIDGLDIIVEAASESAEDQAIAEAVALEVKKANFEDMVSDLLDGLGKGRSSIEMVWKPGKQWVVDEFLWRDPRYFQWSDSNPHELRIRDEVDLKDGVPLPTYRFINHVPKLKTGIPVRNGLARIAAAAYMCKSFTLRDWMSFVELFGMPVRVGRYGPSAGDKEKSILRNALANLGSDAAAMIPESMNIEFIERKASGSAHVVFKDLAEWLDRGLSKAVLGQTASTEGTPGKLGNESSQDDVRDDIKRSDAKQLGRTLTRDFARAFVDINYGADKACPSIKVYVPDNEDIAALVDALDKLVPHGLKVSQSVVRDKLGLPDPEDDAELLQANVGVKSSESPEPPVQSASNSQHVTGCQCDGCTGKALNRTAANDDIDELGDEVLNDWEQLIKPLLSPVETLANDCRDDEEFRARLPELLQSMDSTALLDALAVQTFKARGLGNAG